MQHKERDGTVLHDATSKLSQNYAGFQVRLEKTHSLGAVAVLDDVARVKLCSLHSMHGLNALCGQLGSCPGAGVSYNTARSRAVVFVCKICLLRVSHV